MSPSKTLGSKIPESSNADSLAREHSLFCESTGPIVQEGFVASRIRAFQALENVIGRKKSHSPMVPCPVPPWRPICEPEAPPKPIYSLRSPRKAMAPPPGRDPRPKSDYTGRHMTKKTSRRQLCQNSSRSIRSRQDEQIHGPKAIPPSLASIFDHPLSTTSVNSDTVSSAGSRHIVRSRRSVADKLGSLVDREWAGCDFIDKASEENLLLEPEYPAFHGRKQRGYGRSISVEDRLHQFESLNEQKSKAQETIQATDETQIAPKADGKKSTDNASLGPLPGAGDSPLALTKIRDRAWTFSGSHETKLPNEAAQQRTLSLGQMIDRQLSDWKNLGTLSRNDSKMTGTGSAIISEAASSNSPFSNRPASRQSSIFSLRSKRSASRTPSWLSKISRYRLALVDKSTGSEPQLQKPRNASAELPEVEETRDLQDGQTLGDIELVQSSRGVERKNDGEDANPQSGIGSRLEAHDKSHLYVQGSEKIPCERSVTPGVVCESFPAVGTITTSEREARKPESNPISPPPSQEKELRPLLKEDLGKTDVQQSHKAKSRIESDRKRRGAHDSHSSSISPPTKAHGSEAASKAFNHSASDQASSSPPARPARVRRGSTTHAAVSHTTSIREIKGESTEGLQWESTAKGKGIKRVQVIVSLDGADDLLVEATLMKRGSRSS